MSCKEQNSRGNKRPRRVAQQGDDTTVPRQWLDSCTVRRRCIPRVGTAILESQNRRASPEDHCGRPHLPVSQCRFLLAFDGQTASSEPDTEWTFLRMKISAPLGSQHEELAQGMALAEEPTWRLSANGWAVIH